jgi:RNA-binding motif X-linked protein 2
MQQIQKIQKLNQLELDQGLTDTASWHDQFRNSAYIYVGGLDLNLTEGDIITIFSQ